MKTFIDEDKIHNLLEKKKKISNKEFNSILAKALLLKGLDLEDTAALLSISDKNLLQKLFLTALKIKNLIY